MEEIEEDNNTREDRNNTIEDNNTEDYITLARLVNFLFLIIKI